MVDGSSSKSGLFDERKNAIEKIEDSDIFNRFKNAFIKEVRSAKGISIEELSKNQLILNKDGRADIISSAKAQGFNVVVETVLSTDARTFSDKYVDYQLLAKARVTATRINDGKVLWKSTSGYSGPCEYNIANLDCGKAVPSVTENLAERLAQQP